MDTNHELPLFLLHTVLFPGQRLALKVFEARYMDMISACLKENQSFGICLIRAGEEVGPPAEPVGVGVLACIERWEMPTPGVLHIECRGTRRFSVLATRQRGQLVVADVDYWTDEVAAPVPEEFANLRRFLAELLTTVGDEEAPANDMNDARWVGLRLAQLLPIDNATKQNCLEMRDPLLRLALIRSALERLAYSD